MVETTELTREQLYELVWQTPMSRLAEQYGISGNGLAKVCRRLDVPYPPRGWWAKKAAGKKLAVDPLPPARPETLPRVAISPTPTDEDGLKAAIRQKREELDEIRVPDRLAQPHPLIARWIEEHRKRLEEARRERDPRRRSLWGVADYSGTDRRRHRVLHALFYALEQHGATTTQTERGELLATICGEKIEFSLSEKSRQVTRPMTAKEKEWESWNKSGVKTELEPTGYLQFSIKAWIGQPFRKNWLEGERRPIDAMLPEIVATFLVVGPLLAERTRLREQRARQFAEEQRNQELEEQRRRQDENRWRRFVEIAEGWQRSALAREFIARLREIESVDTNPVDGWTLTEWLDWAEDRAKRTDPLEHGLHCIFGDIAEVKSWTYPR